jgi:hypothetical protein
MFQTNQEAQRLFAPWLQVMDMQITRALDEARKREGRRRGAISPSRSFSTGRRRRPSAAFPRSSIS